MSAPEKSPATYLNARTWLAGLIAGVIRLRPQSRLWAWLDTIPRGNVYFAAAK